MMSPMRSLLCKTGKPCPDVSALRAQDPYIESVLAYCEYTVSYLLDETEETAKWERTDIQGPVYLVRRRNAPRFQLMVKSVQGSQGIKDIVHPDWDLDPKENYLFYKTQYPEDQIRGLWFQNDTHRHEFTEAIEGVKIALVDVNEDSDPKVEERVDESRCLCCLPGGRPPVKVQTYVTNTHFSEDPGAQTPYAPRKMDYVPLELEVFGVQKPHIGTPSTGCPTSPDFFTSPDMDEQVRHFGSRQPCVHDSSSAIIKPSVPFFNFDNSIPYSYGSDGL